MKETTQFTIKQFSDFTGVSQDRLRHYDEIGLLKPAVRGDNRYRFYLPVQIIYLNYIEALIDLDVPLKTIKELSPERTPEKVLALLSKQEKHLIRQLDKIKKIQSMIKSFRENMQSGITAGRLLDSGSDIGIEILDEVRYRLGPQTDASFKESKTFYKEFINFYNDAGDRGINLRCPIGGYHENFNHFLTAPNRPDRFFSQDPTGNRKNPAGEYLVGYYRGYYGVFGNLPERLAAYAKEHNYILKGSVLTMYLHDEISIVENDKYLSRLSVMVSKT